MEKITIKDLVGFRRKSDRSKKTFANKVRLRKKSEDKSSEGGDYWSSCLSAIRNVFKNDDTDLLHEKIESLNDKIKLTEIDRIKSQFKRNIDILTNFEDFDFQVIKPNLELTFHRKQTVNSIINIKGFPLQAWPCHVFSFSENNSEEIGSIWFIAKLDGYTKSELGMFADISYRYLAEHFSKEFFVNPSYCIAVDVFNGQKVSYAEIEKGEIPVLIENTIDEIIKLY